MSTRTAELCRLTLFRDILSGPTTVLTAPGDYDLSDAPSQLGDVNDDDVTSLRLDGEGCSVELYENNDYSGWKTTFDPGEHDPGKLVHAGGRMTKRLACASSMTRVAGSRRASADSFYFGMTSRKAQRLCSPNLGSTSCPARTWTAM